MPTKFTKLTGLVHKKGFFLFILILLVTAQGYGAISSVDDSWTQLTSMPTPRANFRAAVVDGKIYVIGGTLTEGTDFSKVSYEEIKHVQDMLNERIRKTLDWKSPEEVFYKLTGAIKT